LEGAFVGGELVGNELDFELFEPLAFFADFDPGS
jgi:hypothetical protein